MGPLQVPVGDWSIRLVTPPASEPLTLSQAKLHLKIDDSLTEEDDDVTALIGMARNHLEESYGVRVMPQQVEFLYQQFPHGDRFRIPIWPVRSFDYFRYTDVAGVQRELVIGEGPTPNMGLLSRRHKKPPELVLPWAQVWPALVLQMADAIAIGVSTGWLKGDSPESMPMPGALLHAMKLLITHGYENRSAVTLGTLMVSKALEIGVGQLMANIRLW